MSARSVCAEVVDVVDVVDVMRGSGVVLEKGRCCTSQRRVIHKEDRCERYQGEEEECLKQQAQARSSLGAQQMAGDTEGQQRKEQATEHTSKRYLAGVAIAWLPADRRVRRPTLNNAQVR